LRVLPHNLLEYNLTPYPGQHNTPLPPGVTKSDVNMSACPAENDFDGRIGVRISSIFVILVGSFLGTWFPVFAARHPGAGVPSWAFFIAKYFGSGVIVATAFIHVSNRPV
jgi:hypothetical protein